MILAFLSFGLALAQVLIQREVVSKEQRLVFSVVVTSLSAIPLTMQLAILLGELSRAKKYSFQLLLHRLVMSILGDYGPASNLIAKYYLHKKFFDYAGAKGRVWIAILSVNHCFVKLFGAIAFGDAFSGTFLVRYYSVALWLDSTYTKWPEACAEPSESDYTIDLSKFQVISKDVRYVRLTATFYPQRPPTTHVPVVVTNEVANGIAGGLAHGVTNGVAEEVSNGVAGEVPNRVADGIINRVADGITNRAVDGVPEGFTSGVSNEITDVITDVITDGDANGVTDGVENGIPNEITHGITYGDPNGVTDGVPNAGASRVTGGNTEDPNQDPIELYYDIVATGSQENNVAKLYAELHTGWCSKPRAKEFLKLMQALDTDSFFVQRAPKDTENEILQCEKLKVIVKSILDDGKRVNAKWVRGATYV